MSVQTKDGGDARRYYSEIPNIVCALGLSPFELALYVHLKKTAGADGECWKSTDTLAKETGMSAGMITKAKEGLIKPRPELGNKPLIVVKKVPNPQGGKPRHHVTLTDIWPENMARFSSSQGEVTSSPHELASSYSEIASSPGEIKKKPREERTQEEKSGTAAPSRALKSEKPYLKRDPLLNHGAVVIYRDICHLTPNHGQRKDIAAKVTDFVEWAEVCSVFMREGRPPQRVDWLLERYEKAILARGQPEQESKAAKQERLKREWQEKGKRNGQPPARPAG